MNCGVSRACHFPPGFVAHHRFGKRQTYQLKAIFQSNFWYLLQGIGALGQFTVKVTTVLFNMNLSLWRCSLELLQQEKSIAKSLQISNPYIQYLPSWLIHGRSGFFSCTKRAFCSWGSLHKSWKCWIVLFCFHIKEDPCIFHIRYLLLVSSREHHWVIKTSMTKAWVCPSQHWAWWQQHKHLCFSTCVLPLLHSNTLTSAGRGMEEKHQCCWGNKCAGGINVLENVGADSDTEKELSGQALTHCVQRGLGFGGAVVRTINVTASKQS